MIYGVFREKGKTYKFREYQSKLLATFDTLEEATKRASQECAKKHRRNVRFVVLETMLKN